MINKRLLEQLVDRFLEASFPGNAHIKVPKNKNSDAYHALIDRWGEPDDDDDETESERRKRTGEDDWGFGPEPEDYSSIKVSGTDYGKSNLPKRTNK